MRKTLEDCKIRKTDKPLTFFRGYNKSKDPVDNRIPIIDMPMVVVPEGYKPGGSQHKPVKEDDRRDSNDKS